MPHKANTDPNSAIYRDLITPAWDQNGPLWRQKLVQVDNISRVFLKPVTSVKDWADEVVGPDGSLLIWFFTMTACLACVYAALFFTLHIKVSLRRDV